MDNPETRQCWAQNTEQIQRTNKPTEERKIQRDDTQNSQKKPDVNPGARER